MLNNFKGIERYNYYDINQAIQGEASNGEEQLELYVRGKIEDFALQSGDKNELRILITAINDQMGPNAELYDYNYYQEVKDVDRLFELREKAKNEEHSYYSSDEAGVSAIAKSLLDSGTISKKSIKQAVKKKGFLGEMKAGLMEGMGINDIKDEFTEIGNEFREELGLKTKMTNAEKKELAELEERKRKQELQNAKKAAIENMTNNKSKVQKFQGEVEPVTIQPVQPKPDKASVKEQMELLEQLKKLFDMDVLTKEEFEQKKNEILNM